MNKKGFLLGEETVKIVIALICLFFLVLLLFYIYFSHRSSKDLELAKESLNYLAEQMSMKAEEIEIYNPRGWGLISFKKTNSFLPIDAQLPNQCIDKKWENCLCICKLPSASVKSFIVTCSNDAWGVCLDNEFAISNRWFFEMIEYNSIEIENPPVMLSIDYENKIIKKQEKQNEP